MSALSAASIRGIGKCASISQGCAEFSCTKGIRRAVLSGLVGDVVFSYSKNASMSDVELTSYGQKEYLKRLSKHSKNQPTQSRKKASNGGEKGEHEEVKKLLQTLSLCPYCFEGLENSKLLLQHWEVVHGIQTNKKGFQSKLNKDLDNLARMLLNDKTSLNRKPAKLQESDVRQLCSLYQKNLKKGGESSGKRSKQRGGPDGEAGKYAGTRQENMTSGNSVVIDQQEKAPERKKPATIFASDDTSEKSPRKEPAEIRSFKESIEHRDPQECEQKRVDETQTSTTVKKTQGADGIVLNSGNLEWSIEAPKELVRLESNFQLESSFNPTESQWSLATKTPEQKEFTTTLAPHNNPENSIGTELAKDGSAVKSQGRCVDEQGNEPKAIVSCSVAPSPQVKNQESLRHTQKQRARNSKTKRTENCNDEAVTCFPSFKSLGSKKRETVPKLIKFPLTKEGQLIITDAIAKEAAALFSFEKSYIPLLDVKYLKVKDRLYVLFSGLQFSGNRIKALRCDVGRKSVDFTVMNQAPDGVLVARDTIALHEGNLLSDDEAFPNAVDPRVRSAVCALGLGLKFTYFRVQFDNGERLPDGVLKVTLGVSKGKRPCVKYQWYPDDLKFKFSWTTRTLELGTFDNQTFYRVVESGFAEEYGTLTYTKRGKSTKLSRKIPKDTSPRVAETEKFFVRDASLREAVFSGLALLHNGMLGKLNGLFTVPIEDED